MALRPINETITLRNGDVIPGAEMRLITKAGIVAQLFRDPAGSPLAAAIANDNGLVSFYVENDIYDAAFYYRGDLIVTIPNYASDVSGVGLRGLPGVDGIDGTNGAKGPRGNPGATEYGAGTLAELSDITIPPGVDQVLATGVDTVGDYGAGLPLVADPVVTAAYVALHPKTSFIDAAGRGFRFGRGRRVSSPAGLNAIVVDVGGTAGNLGLDKIHIATGNWNLSETVFSKSQSLQLMGEGRPTITWTGAAGTGVVTGGVLAGAVMFRIQDSTAVTLDNMALLGGGKVPDAAIFYDDTDSKVLSSASNESFLVRDLTIGRKWNQAAQIHTGVNNGFKYGLYVGGPNLVNNDELHVVRTKFHDCAIAGIHIASNQSIWSSYADCLFNGCGRGMYTRSACTLRDAAFNRNTIADFSLSDKIVVDIYGFNAENSKLLIEQENNASIRVFGGKALLNASAMPGAYWATFAATRDIRFENWLVDDAQLAGAIKKVKIDASSLQRGRILIKHCRLPRGDTRDGYELNVAANTAGLRFDIEEGGFRAKGTLEGTLAWDPPLLEIGADANTALQVHPNADIIAGDPVLASFSPPQPDLLLVGNAYIANTLYARFYNRTGGSVNPVAGKLRWRKISNSEIKAKAGKTVDFGPIPSLAQGVTTLSVPCKLGDFVHWGCSIDHRNLLINAYVSAENVVTINATNLLGAAIDLASATYTATVLRDDAFDFIGSAVLDPEPIADGAGLGLTVPVPGAAPGDMAVAAFGDTLAGLAHTVQVSAADTATIRLHNETGAAVDFTAMAVRVGTMTMPG